VVIQQRSKIACGEFGPGDIFFPDTPAVHPSWILFEGKTAQFMVNVSESGLKALTGVDRA